MRWNLTIEQRFWSKVRKTEGCWEWSGERNPKGYARFFIGGRKVQAHRFSYELNGGTIPSEYELDHLCRNRGCIRPDHLEPKTHKANVMCGTSVSVQHALKTHCPRGHEYTPTNTRLQGNKRHCRACNAPQKRDAKLRRQALREGRA